MTFTYFYINLRLYTTSVCCCVFFFGCWFTISNKNKRTRRCPPSTFIYTNLPLWIIYELSVNHTKNPHRKNFFYFIVSSFPSPSIQFRFFCCCCCSLYQASQVSSNCCCCWEIMLNGFYCVPFLLLKYVEKL